MHHPDAETVMASPTGPVSGGPIAVETTGVEATEALGEAVARRLLTGGPPPPLLLHGPLGSGKTAFVRGLARGLGCRVTPKSPTFALHLGYAGALRLEHLDLYRLDGAAAFNDLGLEEIFTGGHAVAVEWAEKLGPHAPAGALHLTFEMTGENRRRIVIEGPREWLARMAGAAGPLSGAGTGAGR